MLYKSSKSNFSKKVKSKYQLSKINSNKILKLSKKNIKISWIKLKFYKTRDNRKNKNNH